MQHIICERKAPPEIVAMLSEWHTGENDAEEFVDQAVEGARHDNFTLNSPTGGYSGPVTALMWMLQARSVPNEDRARQIESGFYDDMAAMDLMSWDGICLSLVFACDDLLDRLIAQIPDFYLSEIIAQFDKEQQPRIRKFFLN
tara:strand:- start:38 stop:466 length:429 start_codon:yes stop_codon:yes gene_type:complete